MRYRVHFRHGETGEENVREIEATGTIYRICDDHGHVVFGEGWPKKEHIIFPPVGREPAMFRDD